MFRPAVTFTDNRRYADATQGYKRPERPPAETPDAPPALLALLAALIAAPALAQGSRVQATYVALGPNGVATARVITAAPTCPAIVLDGKRHAMSVRAPAAVEPLRKTRSTPELSKPSDFPVLTCEARLPPGVKRASIAGRRLPMPKAQYRRIVVIGDTGCRIKTSDDAYQACNDPRQYPFARVAKAAAAFRPDVVLHVGDDLYRENPCPEGNAGCAGSPWGYGWDAWRADFFDPGAALLAAAPWILVRGNHENCERAGQGWWRFLDPRPLLAHRDCNAAVDDPIGDASPPYGVPLGGGVQVVVLDTANTGNAALKPGDPRIAQYETTWIDLAALAKRSRTNWVALHHPLLAFAAEQKDGQINLLPGNQGIISVFSARSPTLLPAKVSLVLSGHVHVWQQVSFSSAHPSQFVAGFSGTQEDIVPLPPTLAKDASPAPGAVVAHYASWVDGFGFMTMERTGRDRWRVVVHDDTGAVKDRCRVVGKRSWCEIASVDPKGG